MSKVCACLGGRDEGGGGRPLTCYVELLLGGTTLDWEEANLDQRHLQHGTHGRIGKVTTRTTIRSRCESRPVLRAWPGSMAFGRHSRRESVLGLCWQRRERFQFRTTPGLATKPPHRVWERCYGCCSAARCGCSGWGGWPCGGGEEKVWNGLQIECRSSPVYLSGLNHADNAYTTGHPPDADINIPARGGVGTRAAVQRARWVGAGHQRAGG